MSRYKFYAIFLLLISIGLAAVVLIQYGYYPVVIVNGNWITEKEFDENYQAASVYYKNILDFYKSAPSSTASQINENLQSSDIQGAVFNGLIENKIIDAEAKAEVGSNLSALISQKINQAVHNTDLNSATEKFYGLDEASFQNEILKPQAEQDILREKFLADGKDFDSWLANAKKSASVFVLVGGFSWDGKEMVPGK